MNIVLLLLNCLVGLFLAVLITQFFKWLKTDYQTSQNWILTGIIGSVVLALLGIFTGVILLILLSMAPRPLHRTIQIVIALTAGVMLYGGSAGSIVLVSLMFCRYVLGEIKRRFNGTKNS